MDLSRPSLALRPLVSLNIMRDPYGAFARWQQRYGDTFTVNTAAGDVLLTGDPELVRAIFAAPRDVFEPFNAHLAAPLVGEHSLLLLSGDAHARERKLVMPPFHGARMKAYGDVIAEAARRAAGGWAPDEPVVIREAAEQVTLDVILRAVFGLDVEEELADCRQAVLDFGIRARPSLLFFTSLQSSWGGLSPWNGFCEARDRLDAIVLRQIERLRATGHRGTDIASLLLDATYEDGTALSDAALLDQLRTLLVTGYETTTVALTWAVHHLLSHPDALARLRAELDGLDAVTPEAVARLGYLDAVCRETLRLNPLIPGIHRTLRRDWTLGDRTLKAGETVAAVTALVHYRDDLYPDPHAFRPERFLDRGYRPWEYFPFGGGTRRCIGEALATWELKVTLAIWLSEHALSLRQGAGAAARKNLVMAPSQEVLVDWEGPRRPEALH